MAAKKKAKPNAKKSVKRNVPKKRKAQTRRPRKSKREQGLAAMAGYEGAHEAQDDPHFAEAPFEVAKVFANEHAVFCIANDQRVYKWDTRGAVWKLFKDGI